MLRRRIVVVDDDPDLRGMFLERLTNRWYRVETVENWHDAMIKLDQAVFEGVLLVCLMPGVTGAAVLQQIRQHRPWLAVVVMTVENSSRVAARVLARQGREPTCSSSVTRGYWSKGPALVLHSGIRMVVVRNRQRDRGQGKRDALVDSIVSQPPTTERLIRMEGVSTMNEPKRHDALGLSPLPGSLVHSAGGRCATHRKPLRLTISVRKIDLIVADIQKQVEDLHRQMTNLRLVRTQLAGCQQENWGDEGGAPYNHTALVDMRSDS